MSTFEVCLKMFNFASILLVTIFTKSCESVQQRFIEEPSSVSVMEGENVTLSCSVDNKMGVLQWTKGNVSQDKLSLSPLYSNCNSKPHHIKSMPHPYFLLYMKTSMMTKQISYCLENILIHYLAYKMLLW